jgi:formylglycine-generating enzyme required for sulfatase activity
MALVRIPAGAFVMRGTGGSGATRARIDAPFWIGACEVSNAQFACFAPDHDSGFARSLRIQSTERKTRPLNGPEQPVVRVSWHQAMAFCRWLSDRTGLRVSLPTEAQWEYACRAGADTPFWWGGLDPEAGSRANMAGKEIWAGGDRRFKDGAVASVPVGSLKPNAWGLHHMHGNVAEWTVGGREKRVVRGGSFFDRADWCRAGARYAYPAWQRVYSVGFRVVCTDG